MTKVEVKNELIAEVRKMHRRYKDLDARHVVETALHDYVELTQAWNREALARGR